MKDFQVISEAEDSYHLKHKNGNTFTIEKAKLSPKAHEMIQKYCMGGEAYNQGGYAHYDEGTVDVQPSDVNQAYADSVANWNAQNAAENALASQQAAADRLAYESKLAQFNGTKSEPSKTPVAPAAVAIPQAQVSNPSQSSAIDPLITNKFMQGQLLENQQKNVQDYINALKSNNGNAAGAYSELTKGLQQSQANLAQNAALFKQRDDNLYQKVLSNPQLNPDRYFQNMSTGSKIASAIGLALSGIGSGLTGKPNLAAEHLNNAIATDIQDQMNDKSKNLNLWKLNREGYNDDLRTMAATQNQMLSLAQAKIAMAAQNTTNQENQFKLKTLMNDIDMQKANNYMRMSQYQQGAQSGQGSLIGTDPVNILQGIQAPPEQIKQALAEVETAQNVTKNRKNILDAFDAAANSNTAMKTGFGYLREPPEVGALHQQLLPSFKDIDGTVRQAAMDETFHNVTPRSGDLPETIKTKRQGLINWIDSKSAAPTFKMLTGMPLAAFQSTAGSNSPEIKVSNGHQYMKVPGGWKLVK